ncbi:semaphorin-1A-like [Amblyomma americanum]|uniref:Semaphorin-1A n=1 Tax=Amblyomma americanum TaxID=6943 RepID=A0AAQ4DAU2_AMBAM
MHPASSVLWPVLLAALLPFAASTWEKQLEPKLFIEEYPHQLVRVFPADNVTASPGEYLRLLLLDGDYVLVGGRNYLYNLSVHTLDQVGNISWPASSSSNPACAEHLAQSAAGDLNCANFIRVARHLSPQSLLVCGTNSYSPRCREYKYDSVQRNYSWKTDVDGQAICPQDRNSSAAVLFVNNRQIAGLSARTSAPKTPAVLAARPLTTKPEDPTQLGADAEFVGAFAFDEHAYFFLTESAPEKDSCGPRTAATVMRVCVSDPGGAPPHDWMWTTLQKVRLHCSLNGTRPFVFTDVTTVSPIMTRWNSAFVFYALFRIQGSPFKGSAVCAFSVDDLVAAIKDGKPEREKCPTQATIITNETQFLEDSSPLSRAEVRNYLSEPMLAHVGFDYHYTSLWIDPQVRTASGKRYDVFFIGTSHGHVIKAINVGQNSISTVVIEDIIVFPGEDPVLELKIVRRPGLVTLLVTTYHELVSVPLDNCNWTVRTCTQCVGLQDPYCAWNKDTSKCESLVDQPVPKNSVQEVVSGHSLECPDEFSKHLSNMKFPHGSDPWSIDNTASGTARGGSHLYSAHTLGFAITFCIMGSIVVGFGVGYWYRHNQRKDMAYFNYR